MNNQLKKLEKQRLQRVHVVSGISFSLLMYIAVFFGIFAILLPYIQVWEKPSRHIEYMDVTKIDYANMVDPIISDPNFPTNNIEITLPGYQHDPVLKISHLFVEPILFDPNTKERLNHEGDQSQLAMFLNGMHYGHPLKDVGYVIFGLVAVGGLFLIVGGIMLIIMFKYNDKAKKPVSRFSKLHRKILTWVFPPFIIITLTGALMNIGYVGSGPMTYLVSKGETHDIWTLTGPVLFPPIEVVKKKNESAEMLPIGKLILKAKEINPEVDFEKITLINWKDATARVQIEGYNPYMPFLNGISNKPSVTLDAVNGELIRQHKVMDKHWSGLFFDSAYFLHFLFGVDTFTRLLIASIMGISAFGLGFGVLLWLEKKAQKFPKNIPFYHWMAKLSLSVMIGVFPATGLIFALQWTLPFDLKDRFVWQEGIFFVSWLATFTWSLYRINSYQAAKEFLKLAGILFILSPILHYLNSDFSPMILWEKGLVQIISVDIALFIFGNILLIIGFIVPSENRKIEKFWSKDL
jgi:uncharacterized iron-regulated membrane protein